MAQASAPFFLYQQTLNRQIFRHSSRVPPPPWEPPQDGRLKINFLNGLTLGASVF